MKVNPLTLNGWAPCARLHGILKTSLVAMNYLSQDLICVRKEMRASEKVAQTDRTSCVLQG